MKDENREPVDECFLEAATVKMFGKGGEAGRIVMRRGRGRGGVFNASKVKSKHNTILKGMNYVKKF